MWQKIKLLFFVDADLLTLDLPMDFLPGTDKASKMILKHQMAIDIIAKGLINAPQGTYTVSDADWNETRPDVLYTTRLGASQLPPILIEVQNTVNAAFIQRVMSYALKVIKAHGRLPIILIFGIGSSAKCCLVNFSPATTARPWMHSMPCNLWAKSCNIISKETISDFDPDEAADPLLALSLFFTEQQPSLYTHSRHKDPTIIALYKLAHSLMDSNLHIESNFTATVTNICSTNERLFHKLQEHVDGIPKAKKIVDKGIEYKESSDSELEYPDKLPLKLQTASRSSTMSESDFGFINKFKDSSRGRMNWEACLALGHNEKLLENYTTPGSLKVSYSRAKKVQKTIHSK